MFERFTATVRQTVQVAYGLAREQGVDELREEHLLQALLIEPDTARLLALLGVSRPLGEQVLRAVAAAREHGGLSEIDAAALADLGIDLEAVVQRTEAELGPGALKEAGRGSHWRPGGTVPVSSGVAAALRGALRETVALGDREIRPEHLLLGLLAGRSVLSDAMAARGITIATVLSAIERERARRG